MEPRRTVPAMGRGEQKHRLDLLEALFVFSAFLAPMQLQVFRAFTVYDLLTALLAILILTGPPRMSPIPTTLQIGALALIGAALASSFRSLYPVESLSQTVQFVFVFFVQLPVILTIARSRRVVFLSLAALIAGYQAVVLLAIFAGDVQLAGRVVPFFSDNANALATPAVLLAPFVLFLSIDLWKKGNRWWILLGGAILGYLMIWALTASASRGSTGATIVSVGLFVVFRQDSRLDRALAGIVVVGVVLVLGAIVSSTNVFPDTLESRVQRSIVPEEGREISGGRIALDRAGLQAFFESPFVGVGFDNFRYVGQFYDDEAEFHDPHNLWIQLLSQTGIIGAGAFAFIVGRWLVLLLRTRASLDSSNDRAVLLAFIAAFVGILIQSMIAPLVLHRHYWLLYGLGMATASALAMRLRGAKNGDVPTLRRETMRQQRSP